MKIKTNFKKDDVNQIFYKDFDIRIYQVGHFNLEPESWEFTINHPTKFLHTKEDLSERYYTPEEAFEAARFYIDEALHDDIEKIGKKYIRFNTYIGLAGDENVLLIGEDQNGLRLSEMYNRLFFGNWNYARTRKKIINAFKMVME